MANRTGSETELHQRAKALIARTRTQRGLPATIEDEDTLRAIARILAGAAAKPKRRGEAA